MYKFAFVAEAILAGAFLFFVVGMCYIFLLLYNAYPHITQSMFATAFAGLLATAFMGYVFLLVHNWRKAIHGMDKEKSTFWVKQRHK